MTFLGTPEGARTITSQGAAAIASGKPKPRRSRSSAKAAGTRFETLVAKFLAERLNDDRIERRAKNGSKDRGDLTGLRTIRGGRVAAELKDTARLSLSHWINEAEIERGNDDACVGVVIHKRHGVGTPSEQYVTMTLETFARLLEGGNPL